MYQEGGSPARLFFEAVYLLGARSTSRPHLLAPLAGGWRVGREEWFTPSKQYTILRCNWGGFTRHGGARGIGGAEAPWRGESEGYNPGGVVVFKTLVIFVWG